jgi:hypothetical protein
MSKQNTLLRHFTEMKPRKPRITHPSREVSLPSPYRTTIKLKDALKSLGEDWQKWTMRECIEVSLAFRPHADFRNALMRWGKDKRRRAVSVSQAARMLNMHRASVHRYLHRNPGMIRNSRGKVILPRLIEEVAHAKKQESRGRRTALRPARPQLNKLPPHLRHFRSTFSEFHAWREELGMAWLNWSPADCLDMAETLAPFADFVAQLNARALRLMQAQAAEVPAA